MSTQPIIYLDIDGVLNSYRDHKKICESLERGEGYPENFLVWKRNDYVDVRKLSLLQKFITNINALVVIVSSWDCFEGNEIEICDFLDVPLHSKAFYTGGGYQRESAIIRHANHYGIPEHSYIIIDDSHEYYKTQRLVYINGRVGLQSSDIEKAYSLL